jgi:hypothetical protein
VAVPPTKGMGMSASRRIEAEPPSGAPPYAHLVPLVEALIEHGNELAHPPTDGGVFSVNQGGWVAYLRKRIDWPWVEENFELPELLRYDAKEDEIFDHKNWVSILGSERTGRWFGPWRRRGRGARRA